MKRTRSDVTHSRPAFETSEIKVKAPTIIVEAPSKNGEREIFVQWFAEFSWVGVESMEQERRNAFLERFQQMQLLFPVPLSSTDDSWIGHPEWFQVILLGQLKDWPTRVVDRPEVDDLDIWVLLVISSRYGGVTVSGGDEPACFYIPFTDPWPTDPTLGAITPRKYCNTTVLAKERERYKRRAFN